MKFRRKTKFHSDDGELLRPRAAALIESMRDIGYSLESAVADIVDNSIDARAKHIDVRAGWANDGSPWLVVIDDGDGMTSSELNEAMRPGAKSPLESRPANSLGRFGLGLKTASFSQCRRLTVLSRAGRKRFGRIWDLDFVAERDEWLVLKPSDEDIQKLPCQEELVSNGTMVVWEKLDRLDLGHDKFSRDIAFNERITSIRDHLSLVFHRFILPEKGKRKLVIRINGRPVEAFDPFNAGHLSTDALPEETIDIDGVRITLQPFILPHHTKTTREEYERLAGPEGYLRSQGFYIYRNRRLIIHGTWFRLAKQEELTKLARVRIDIPNTLDNLWKIDVRKSRAQPPEVVRRRMKVVLDQIRSSARRPYTFRGTVVQKRNTAAVWQRREFNSKISYVIDPSHPLLEDFRADMPTALRDRFDLLLKMIESSFPAPLFFTDMASAPTRSELETISAEELFRLADFLRQTLHDLTASEYKHRLMGIEPFASHPEVVADYIENMKEART